MRIRRHEQGGTVTIRERSVLGQVTLRALRLFLAIMGGHADRCRSNYRRRTEMRTTGTENMVSYHGYPYFVYLYIVIFYYKSIATVTK